jgi:hypothetical protein
MGRIRIKLGKTPEQVLGEDFRSRFSTYTACGKGLFRQPTANEYMEMNRIIDVISKGGADPNVSDVYLKDALSPRQYLMLLTSECEEIIHFMFFLEAFERKDIMATLEDKYSFYLYCLVEEPGILPELRELTGIKTQNDVSNILKTIRVHLQYYRRPKRSQRKRGYTDKGHQPTQQQKCLKQIRLDEAVEEARALIRHSKEISDLKELLIGFCT